ncbi:hypothetical protein HYS28_01770 [Candidatus Uhrbacteria bacterium]|nr:hypothetical protein [Candidatus Uhrbacteria bacterium]
MNDRTTDLSARGSRPSTSRIDLKPPPEMYLTPGPFPEVVHPVPEAPVDTDESIYNYSQPAGW